MQTNEIHEIHDITIPFNKTCPFGKSKVVLDPDMPIYPASRGTYIWYKDSIPEDSDSRILSDEYDVLYQSVKRTEYKSQLKMYVSVYSVCLTVVIFMMISFPFLPDAYASMQADKSSAMLKEGIDPVSLLNHPPEAKPNIEVVEGLSMNNLGFTDLKNNVIYVNMPNGMYTIQESSWNVEEKAVNRIMRIKSLGITNSDGNKVAVSLESVEIPEKGNWHRVKIGEFASLNEAILAAEEIRAEEKSRNISELFLLISGILRV